MESVSKGKLFAMGVTAVMCMCWFRMYTSLNTDMVVNSIWTPRQQTNVRESQDIPCVDRKGSLYGRVEDIFCMNTCELSPIFKNPCFYDYLEGGRKKLRCLPHYYILGVAKAGTTDLYRRLNKHPQVMSNRGDKNKEINFWGWKRYGVYYKWSPCGNLTVDDYMDKFQDIASRLETNNSLQIVTGDGSPRDFYDFRKWPLIPQNLGRTDPLILTPSLLKHFHNGHMPKLIITLREPVERTFSHYLHKRGSGTVEEFHTDVIASLKTMDECIKQYGRKYCFFDNKLFFNIEVTIQYSCYPVFLREWFNVFPRSSMFITRLEDRSADLNGTFRNLFKFLEIDVLSDRQLAHITQLDVFNINGRKASLRVLPKTFALLREFYRDCNTELAEMLNDDRFLWNDVYEKRETQG